MKLYSYPISSSAWRVRLALELKGIDYEIETVDLLLRGDERGPEFSSKSPLQQVPALEIPKAGGVDVLTQSMAIIEYLEETHPEPALLPHEPATRALARECAELVNAGIQPLQNIAVQKKIRELGVDPLPFVKHFVRRGLVALEKRLAAFENGPFSLGAQLSLVDIYVVPQLFASRRVGILLDDLSRLLEIEAHCAKLPAFERAHPAAQPDRLA